MWTSATSRAIRILKDISLYAKPGQKIAFVGSTGAGKTTITNLINRFYDVQGGRVLYDGIDVRDIRKDALRRSLGIVLQDTHLFTGTIADNIRFGKLDATTGGDRAGGPASPTPTPSSAACPRDMTPWSPPTAPISPRASGSCWPSPGRRWPIRRC